VISTVLLRFSLSTPKPYDLAVGLVAMAYGICMLAVFSYFTRVFPEAKEAISQATGGGDSGGEMVASLKTEE
jgi:hypothetical protein